MCLYGDQLGINDLFTLSYAKGGHLLECPRVREPPLALPTVGVGTIRSMTFSTAVRLECLDVNE